MEVNLAAAPRASRLERLEKYSDLFAAAKFPERIPRIRELQKAEILRFWEKRRDAFKIENI